MVWTMRDMKFEILERILKGWRKSKHENHSTSSVKIMECEKGRESIYRYLLEYSRHKF